jgi:hypothetical protein
VQEYFTARALVELSAEGGDPPLLEALRQHALDPAWREPLVLGLGMLHRSDYPLPTKDRQALRDRAWQTLLTLDDPAAAVLPNRALLAAAAFPECAEGLAEEMVQAAVRELLAAYRPQSPGLLEKRLQRAFGALQDDPTAGGLEKAIIQAVQDPAFEIRWAALDLLIETRWYASQAVLQALLAAWLCRAAPSGAMMVALYNFHEKHPDWFVHADLPFRRAVENDPSLWQRAAASPAWRALLTALYLAPWQEFTPQNIWRDSPLTPRVLAALQRDDASGLLKELHTLTTKADALARDAALGRIALEDDSLWREVTGADASRSWAGSLVFLSSLALDLVPALELARALDRALELELARARALDRALELELARARDVNLALARNHARDLDLHRALDLARDLDLHRALTLVFVRSLARDLDLDRDLEEIARSIRAARTRWNEDAKIQAALAQAEERLQVWLRAAAQPVYLQALVRLSERFPPSTQAQVTPPPLDLANTPLPDLIAALTAPDDTLRRAARRALEEPPPASALGRERLEAFAALAAERAADPRVGTPIEWMLHKVMHDRPDWVQAWMDAAAQEENTPAERLLASLHKPDKDVARLVLESLPHASRRVNLALLHALRWAVVIASEAKQSPASEAKQSPASEAKQSPAREALAPSAAEQSSFLKRLESWLNEAQDGEIAAAMVDVPGHWKTAPAEAARILLAFLQRADPSRDANVEAAAQHALARLAAREESLRPQALALLEAALPASAPALARLLATQHKDAAALLEALNQRLSDPTALLKALLDAGTDDDVWEDDWWKYHDRLVAAVQAHVAAHAQTLPVLLARLRETLPGKDWRPRRMALAAVAACVESFPIQVQNAAGGAQALETLLIQGSQDTGSHNSRRFALTALSYLRAVTPRVVSVLLAALDENIDIVHQDALQAASRFQRIAGDAQEVLNQLITHLHGPSALRAYGVAKLLGALARSPAGEAAALRPPIIRALAEALQDPFSEQKVVVENGSESPLKETLYEELLRAAGWL